jgi:hypothetical protein
MSILLGCGRRTTAVAFSPVDRQPCNRLASWRAVKVTAAAAKASRERPQAAGIKVTCRLLAALTAAQARSAGARSVTERGGVGVGHDTPANLPG